MPWVSITFAAVFGTSDSKLKGTKIGSVLPLSTTEYLTLDRGCSIIVPYYPKSSLFVPKLVFVGTFEATVDGSRIVLPRPICDELGSREVLMFLDPNRQELILYGKKSSQALLETLPLSPETLSKELSHMLANGFQSKVDRKRRLVVPEEFRKRISESKKCYLVGQGHFCVLKTELESR